MRLTRALAGFFNVGAAVDQASFLSWATELESQAVQPLLDVLSFAVTAPPGSPADGDAYLIPSGATGAWAGRTNQVAVWQSGAWRYHAARVGALAYNAATNTTLQFNGTTWAGFGGGGGAVASVFGRTGAVVAVAGDYDSTKVNNASSVSGTTVTGALNTIAAAITSLSSSIATITANAWVVASRIAAGAVDNSKLANMAAGTVKANVTGASAAPTDATASAVLDVIGSTRGAVLYRGAAGWSALPPGAAGNILTTNGAGADPAWAAGGAGSSEVDNAANGARLSFATGVSVHAADVAAATSVFWVPFKSNRIALYNTTSGTWELFSSGEVSVSLAGTASNKNYDVFGYNNSGTLALELVAWTSDKVRATALVRQNGVLCKSGDVSRRYLGTIRTNAAGGQADLKFGSKASGGGEAIISIWNADNRVPVAPNVRNSVGAGYTYNSTTWRNANASATMRISMVRGQDVDDVSAAYTVSMTCGASGDAMTSIGLDSSSPAADASSAYFSVGNLNGTCPCSWTGKPGIGFSYLQALERQATTSTAATFFGVVAGTQIAALNADMLY